MSITDELRKYADRLSDEAARKSEHGFSPVAMKLEGIADRIDAEHEAQLNDAFETCNSDENLESDGWVRLPVDADGEPIHVGDVMDSRVDYLFDGKPFTVRALVLCEDGWEVADGRFGNRYEPDSLRHHREPTVEDVLRDVVTLCHNTWKEESPFHFYDVDDVMESGNIAEFAAKLRLAKEDA